MRWQSRNLRSELNIEMKRVIIIGGGITGLAAAWFLRETADVTVFEATDRVGGKIRTSPLTSRAFPRILVPRRFTSLRASASPW